MTLERLTFSNVSKKGWFSLFKPRKVKHVSGQVYFFRIICANVEMVHRIPYLWCVLQEDADLCHNSQGYSLSSGCEWLS